MCLDIEMRHDTIEVLAASKQVNAVDHLVVAAVWGAMDKLMGDASQLDKFVSDLARMLPAPASIPAQDLPGITRIHLQSAAHMKKTLEMLAPEAFAAGAATADSSSSTEATPEFDDGMAGVADRVPPSAEGMVATLIDLQIFHLRRVQQITTHMRLHAQALRAAAGRALLASNAAEA